MGLTYAAYAFCATLLRFLMTNSRTPRRQHVRGCKLFFRLEKERQKLLDIDVTPKLLAAKPGRSTRRILTRLRRALMTREVPLTVPGEASGGDEGYRLSERILSSCV